MRRRKTLSCTVTCLSLMLLVLSASLTAVAKAPKQESVAATKLAEQEFKNIQVLKGIPADQLIPSMQFITASLGVECEFCHVHGAFDKDDKKTKITARKMITMMMAINVNNFDGQREVTCFSCHRGANKPVATPLITNDPPKMEDAEKKAGADKSVPSASDLLDKYLAAVGGAPALEKITSRQQKGTLTAFGDQHFPVDVYSKAPDRRVSIMHLKGGDSVTAFDGQKGWLSVPGRPAHMMSASENDAARIDSDLYFPAHVKKIYQKLVSAPGEKIDGRDTYLVIGQNEGEPPIRLYFDEETGLLLRLVRFAESPLGRNPTQIDYRDYRPADGVKLPFQWTLARPGNRFTIQVEQLQQNVSVDESRFAVPADPPSVSTKP